MERANAASPGNATCSAMRSLTDSIQQQSLARGLVLVDKADINELIEEWGTIVTLDQDRDNPAFLADRIAIKGGVKFGEREILGQVAR